MVQTIFSYFPCSLYDLTLKAFLFAGELCQRGRLVPNDVIPFHLLVPGGVCPGGEIGF